MNSLNLSIELDYQTGPNLSINRQRECTKLQNTGNLKCAIKLLQTMGLIEVSWIWETARGFCRKLLVSILSCTVQLG